MGTSLACCGEERKVKKQDLENNSLSKNQSQNSGFSILSDQMLEERKEWSKIFVDLRSVSFKNMQTKLSVYEELSDDFTFSNVLIQNERYCLRYKNVLNYSLQQKFSQQIIEIKGQSTKAVENQLKFLQKFDHPFLASSVEYFQDQNEFTLVMDQLPKHLLMNLINQQKKFEETQIRWLGYSLFLLARYLRKNKTILFGFTPENIFVQNPKNFRIIKLTRFTEAISFEHQPSSKITERQFDERYYFSNELYNSSQKINCSADVFAIGVILLEMALGDHPKNMIKGWEQNI